MPQPTPTGDTIMRLTNRTSVLLWTVQGLLALVFLGFDSARAQLGSFGDFPIEINAEETKMESGMAVAQGSVVIRYGAILIYSDYAQYNPDTRDVLGLCLAVGAMEPPVTGTRPVYRM